MTPTDHRQAWLGLSAIQRDCLVAIRRLTTREDTPYGLAIKRELQGMGDEAISHSKLYPNLAELVEAGYVTTTQLDGRTKRYDLTAAGEDLLAQRAQALQTLATHDAATTSMEGSR